MISRARSQVPMMFVVVAVGAVLLGGCLNRKLKPLNPCLVSGVVAEIAVTNIDKIDMLFMVDNSNSMKEEQAKLRTQFGPLITVLTTGDRGDGSDPFPPANDLHLGVVTSDMGLPGVQKVDKCQGLGADGQLLHAPTTDPAVPGCQASYPQFLSFSSDPAKNTPNAQQTATNFQCIATLGTDGCGFEQQLESPLKALWPFDDNRIMFLADPANPPADGSGFTVGHGGDVAGQVAGDNGGFLRNDAAVGLSLIAIIVVTDEEDCSSKSVEHFIPKQFLDANDQRYNEPLNLRCFYHKDELYPVTRYIDGFKALRPDNPNLVIFAAITGVPKELVDKDVLAKTDLTKESQRDAFYANILADTRMQEMVDPASMSVPGQGNLLPSCSTTDMQGVPNGKAYPPVRIVQVAQGFGANGLVQSICQDDFKPALDAIIAIIARQLGAVCLPRPLVRNSDGKVGCEVVWELPPADSPHSADTPTACGQAGWDFLIKPDADRAQETDHGGAICTVAQLAVKGDGDAKMAVATETKGVMYSSGWYYDDFSAELKKTCTGMIDNQQRIAFQGQKGKPPTGVTVKLECLNETQSLANTRTDIQSGIDQPAIGDACDMVKNSSGAIVPREQACDVRLGPKNASNATSVASYKKWPDGIDHSMMCHPELNVCVLKCSTTADCPPAWVCDSRAETKTASGGQSICVNPTCGT
jgi:hypothetical protein